MPRAYGITNAAPYASAPAVGPAGDVYWNTTEKVLYASDGTAWVRMTTQWTPSGNVLLPTDATKAVLQLGSGTMKGRAKAYTTGVLQFSTNYRDDGTSDDAAKPSWSYQLDSGGDMIEAYRRPTQAGSFTLLLRFDATGQLTLPTLGANNPLIFGPRTVKNRLVSFPGFDLCSLSCNAALNAAASAWVQDDVSKPSWLLTPSPANDQAKMQRIAAGGTQPTDLLTLDATGNLTIAGTTATKAAPGTAWVNPSDPRLKYDVGPYEVGLKAITQLHPIRFRYNGLGGTVDDGRVCHGFDTTAVRAVMPECVGTQRVKLNPDDDAETDIATMDVSDITLALVNAVTELAARVVTLEARIATLKAR